MKMLPLISYRTVFTKWMLLSMVSFSGCDGKFYTVEELNLSPQTRHIKAVKENATERTYTKGNKPEKRASMATEDSSSPDEKHLSPVKKYTAEFSGTDSNLCEH